VNSCKEFTAVCTIKLCLLVVGRIRDDRWDINPDVFARCDEQLTCT